MYSAVLDLYEDKVESLRQIMRETYRTLKLNGGIVAGAFGLENPAADIAAELNMKIYRGEYKLVCQKTNESEGAMTLRAA